MNFIRAIMPREDSFFDMFARHADALVAGTATFRGGPSAYADNIRALRG